MKTQVLMIVTIFALAATTSRAQEQHAQFFRIVGPSQVAITDLSHQGVLSWTGATVGATYRIDTAFSDIESNRWSRSTEFDAASPSSRIQAFEPSPPTGMAFVPSGFFLMGDNLGDGWTMELPVHRVWTDSFYMDSHEVTKELWDRVFIWATNHGYSFGNTGQGKGPQHPVHSISWSDVIKWCNARSEMENLLPCYTISGTVCRVGIVTDPICNWSINGYRLPTEAEWEKAARGGLDGGRFPSGATIQHAAANYYSEPMWPEEYDTSPTRGYHPLFAVGSFPHTSPVGTFPPNRFGLYDMAGNVHELCWDWYDETYYSASPLLNPRGPPSGMVFADGNSYRVSRGGCWSSIFTAYNCRVSARDYGIGPGNKEGFRTVRSALHGE